jgi:hypothetical protein
MLFHITSIATLPRDCEDLILELAIKNASGDEKRWMLNQVRARLRKFLGKARESHGLHAPFRVTTHRGHTVLELALEAAESLGPNHYVIDQHGLQIWNPQRKLLRNEE